MVWIDGKLKDDKEVVRSERVEGVGELRWFEGTGVGWIINGVWGRGGGGGRERNNKN